jgi:hypothetical protein
MILELRDADTTTLPFKRSEQDAPNFHSPNTAPLEVSDAGKFVRSPFEANLLPEFLVTHMRTGAP